MSKQTTNHERAERLRKAMAAVDTDASLEELDLLGLREQIDILDTALLALLHRRIDVGHQVGDVKRAQNGAPIFLRPAREARILRHLAQSHESLGRREFPTATILYIWRSIIASTTAMEGELRLALMSDENRNCRKNAILHFSATLDQITETTGAGVLNQVISKKAELGVVSLDDTWWLDERLDVESNNGTQVFAKLPFIDTLAQRKHEPNTDSYVLAQFGLEEPTGDDRTLIASPLDTEFVRRHQTHFLAKTDEDCLLDVPGYLKRSDLGSNEPLRIVGRYATPLLL